MFFSLFSPFTNLTPFASVSRGLVLPRFFENMTTKEKFRSTRSAPLRAGVKSSVMSVSPENPGIVGLSPSVPFWNSSHLGGRIPPNPMKIKIEKISSRHMLRLWDMTSSYLLCLPAAQHSLFQLSLPVIGNVPNLMKSITEKFINRHTFANAPIHLARLADRAEARL